jgi:hypothetical protein
MMAFDLQVPLQQTCLYRWRTCRFRDQQCGQPKASRSQPGVMRSMITSARPMLYAASLRRSRPVVRQTAVRVSKASGKTIGPFTVTSRQRCCRCYQHYLPRDVVNPAASYGSRPCPAATTSQLLLPREPRTSNAMRWGREAEPSGKLRGGRRLAVSVKSNDAHLPPPDQVRSVV